MRLCVPRARLPRTHATRPANAHDALTLCRRLHPAPAACAAGKLLGAIVSGKEVQTDSNGIANVAQCLACYNKANSKLEVRRATRLDWRRAL